MIVKRQAMDRFREAYDTIYFRYIREEYGRALDEFFMNLNFDAIRKYKNEIIHNVPTSHRREIERLINGLIENEEKMRKARSLEDPVIKEYVQAWFERKVEDLNPEILEGGKPADRKDVVLTPETLAEYFPLRVAYRAKTLTHEGYLIFPTKKDLARIEEYLNDGELMDILVKKAVKEGFDEETTTIKIVDREYKFTVPNFARALERSGLWEEANKFLLKKLDEAIPEDIGGKKDTSSIYPSVILHGTAEEFGLEVPEEYRKMKMLIEVSTNTAIYPEVKIDVSAGGDRINLRFRNIPSNIENLKDDLRKALLRVKEKVEFYKPIIDKLYDTAEKKGYLIKPSGDLYYVETEEHPSYTLRKKDITVSLTILGEDKYRVGFRIEKDIGRREITENRIVYALVKFRDVNYHVSKYSGRVYISGDMPEVEDLDKLLDTIESMSKEMDNLIAEYDKEKEKAKMRVPKASTETAVALYLMEFAGYMYNPEEVIGRSRSFIYTTIGRLFRKLAPENYEDLKKYYSETGRAFTRDGMTTIIETMMEKGYIKITPEAEVMINNTTLREILKSTGYFIDELIEDINTSVVSKLAEVRIMMEPYTRYPDYEKLGLASPKLMNILIRTGPALIPPETLAREYNGKPIWEQLDKSTKEYYVEHKADVESLYKMLTDYRDLFRDVHDLALKKLVYYSWSKGTEYLAKHEPRVITGGKRITLYKTKDGFVGVRIGEFVAQVTELKEAIPDSKKTFVVYGIKEKIGVPVTAKTVEEAVGKIKPLYQSFIKEFERLRELEAKGEVRLWETSEKGGFKLYSVIVGRYPYTKEFIVKPGVLKEIGEYKKEVERERKRESISM